MLIVNTGEDFRGDFVGLEKMVEVSASMFFATFAVTFCIHWRRVASEFRIFDVNAPIMSIKGAIPGHASRADAIKSINPILGADE